MSQSLGSTGADPGATQSYEYLMLVGLARSRQTEEGPSRSRLVLPASGSLLHPSASGRQQRAPIRCKFGLHAIGSFLALPDQANN